VRDQFTMKSTLVTSRFRPNRPSIRPMGGQF
jgi:hypothetical protein